MAAIYNALAIPFGYVLHLFYNLFDNYFLSLFILMLIVKMILFPSTISQQKNSAKQIRLQPKVNRIKTKYSSGAQPTREAQMKIQEETQDLYKKEGYSAVSGGCLPMLLQFPVMIGLYGVVYAPLSRVLNIASDVVKNAAEALGISTSAASGVNRYEIQLLDKLTSANMPDSLQAFSKQILELKNQFMLFGKINLTQTPNWKEPSLLWIIPILTLLAGLATSILMYSRQKKTNPEMAKNPTMGCMTFFSPLLSVYFTFIFPAGVGVYWIMSSVFTFFQTLLINYTHNPQKVIATAMVDETVDRRSREANVKKLKEFSEQK